MLAYNCSPFFNWKLNLNEATILKFQNELAAMGYKFWFVTLAGFLSLNYIMFDLAHHYNLSGMVTYSKLWEREFKLEKEKGFSAVKHQSFVGAGYFDEVNKVICGGKASTISPKVSNEEEQFHENDETKLDIRVHNIGPKVDVGEQVIPKLPRRKFNAI